MGAIVTEHRMPLVSPFVGEHFARLDRLSDLLAPPYDVIAEPERIALAARDDQNIVHVILPQGNGDRYSRAAARLEQWRRDRVLVAEEVPAVYVVQQEFAGPGGRRTVRTGLIGAVAAEPFAAGRIKPHERTHAGPKQDRLALMRATRTMFESLLMLTRDPGGELARALGTVTGHDPWAAGSVRGDAVRVWRVEGAAGERLADIAGGDALYIADGHHRFETAVAYRSERPSADRTLALIVSLVDPGLVVLPTHRIIHGHAVPTDMVARLGTRTRVEELAGTGYEAGLARVKASGGGCVAVVPGGLLALTRAPGSDPAPLEQFHSSVRGLDVTWADAYAVATLREACAGRVAYSSDADEVVKQVRDGTAASGVLLNPPEVADVLDVADAGGYMPQKSTYFLPKVPSGLVLLPLDRGGIAHGASTERHE
jgi:uncharacterized protein (DUF1015 family)